MPKTLIIDNFDSFTYNLFQYLAELGAKPVVKRNNEIDIQKIIAENYSHIVISPGPGTPENPRDLGVCADVILQCTDTPILGVCLGHQGIIHLLGGKIVRARQPMHGKTSRVKLDTSHFIFKNLPSEIEVMRYHSLIGERAGLPKDLRIIAETVSSPDPGSIMAVAHVQRPLVGIQFHPESIGTPHGMGILENFLGA